MTHEYDSYVTTGDQPFPLIQTSLWDRLPPPYTQPELLEKSAENCHDYADLLACCIIENPGLFGIGECRMEDQIASVMGERTHTYVTRNEFGTLVGAVNLIRLPDGASYWIENLCRLNAVAGHDVGARQLGKALQVAAGEGATKISLGVMPFNGARQLYEACYFVADAHAGYGHIPVIMHLAGNFKIARVAQCLLEPA